MTPLVLKSASLTGILKSYLKRLSVRKPNKTAFKKNERPGNSSFINPVLSPCSSLRKRVKSAI